MNIKLVKNDKNCISSQSLDEILANNDCIIKVYSDNCIHCINMKPEWDKYVNRMLAHKSKNVYIVEIESSCFDRVENTVVKDSVYGFPTIMHLRNNKATLFEGERENTKMYDWSMKNIADSINIYKKRLQKSKSSNASNMSSKKSTAKTRKKSKSSKNSKKGKKNTRRTTKKKSKSKSKN